jgi:hypothetical protein
MYVCTTYFEVDRDVDVRRQRISYFWREHNNPTGEQNEGRDVGYVVIIIRLLSRSSSYSFKRKDIRHQNKTLIDSSVHFFPLRLRPFTFGEALVWNWWRPVTITED